jgi:hypothetical protein
MAKSLAPSNNKKKLFFPSFMKKRRETNKLEHLSPEAVFLVVCDPSMNELCAN